jgi:hypothetical protein
LRELEAAEIVLAAKSIKKKAVKRKNRKDALTDALGELPARRILGRAMGKNWL